MWVAVLPPGERGVALDFWFPKSPGLDLSTITLWNYNVSLGTLSMGAKEAEIYFRGDLVWRGAVKKGCGNSVNEYGFRIGISGAAPDGVHPDSPGPAAPAAAASPGAVQTPGSSRGRPEGGAAGAIRLSRYSEELLREADRRLEESRIGPVRPPLRRGMRRLQRRDQQRYQTDRQSPPPPIPG